MKAGNDKVISLHYTLTVEGKEVESSHEHGKPMLALLGHDQLLSALEAAVEGHEAGESLAVDVAAADAYGEREEGRIQRFSKKYVAQANRLKPGMTTTLKQQDGSQRAVTVHKVGMSTIDLDMNHPMAGKVLHFELEIVEVREATEEEIAHKHAHAPGVAAH